MSSLWWDHGPHHSGFLFPILWGWVYGLCCHVSGFIVFCVCSLDKPEFFFIVSQFLVCRYSAFDFVQLTLKLPYQSFDFRWVSGLSNGLNHHCSENLPLWTVWSLLECCFWNIQSVSKLNLTSTTWHSMLVYSLCTVRKKGSSQGTVSYSYSTTGRPLRAQPHWQVTVPSNVQIGTFFLQCDSLFSINVEAIEFSIRHSLDYYLILTIKALVDLRITTTNEDLRFPWAVICFLFYQESKIICTHNIFGW